MAKTPFGQYVTPDDAQKVAVPADMWQLAYMLDTRTNLLAADENDRNARYQDVPAGTLVSTPDGWQWIKLTSPPDAPKWKLLHSSQTFTDFNWETDWEDATGRSSIFKDGSNYDLYIETLYTGSDPLNFGSQGERSDIRILTIPSDHRPREAKSGTVYAGYQFSGWFILYASSGTVNITDGRPSTTINPGDTITISGEWTKEDIS